jgi:hypothetical protein
MGGRAIELSIQQGDLTKLSAAMKVAENGAILRADLIKNLRAAIAPAVEEAKSNVRGIVSSPRAAHTKKNIGGGEATSLGDAVARGVSTNVRLTAGAGKIVGVSVRAKKTGMPRSFVNAPKRLNAKKFRHRVFGRDVWVEQIGRPEWFDGPMHARKADARAACIAAMQAIAKRIGG